MRMTLKNFLTSHNIEAHFHKDPLQQNQSPSFESSSTQNASQQLSIQALSDAIRKGPSITLQLHLFDTCKYIHSQQI